MDNQLLTNALGVAALIVALLAMWATFWQATIARRHNRLSVRPVLTFDAVLDCRDDGTTLIVTVVNHGLGPAIVIDCYAVAKGARVNRSDSLRSEVTDVFRQLCGTRLRFRRGDASLPLPGTVVKPGSAVEVVNHHVFDVGPKAFLKELQDFGSFEIVIVFKSIYEEHFDVKYSALTTTSPGDT